MSTDVKGNITVIPASLRPNASSLTSTWDFDNRLTSATTGTTANWWLNIEPATYPGASDCIRSKPSGQDNVPSQQCCYKNGKLITDGVGAGTVDYNTPNHTESDVNPWVCAAWLDGNHNASGTATIKDGPYMQEYLKRCPPNNAKACPKLVAP